MRNLLLARYRGFRDLQDIALSRLSLVYGENNAGKSALVRIPTLLAGSRTVGSAGLELDTPALRGAGFREVQWRGALPAEMDPDLVLGFRLSDQTEWRWTFRWVDSRSLAVVQRLEVLQDGNARAFELKDLTKRYPQDAEYESQKGPVRLVFDGLVPRQGSDELVDQMRDQLVATLDGVTWLSAMRTGPQRGGSPRGARGSIAADGEGAAALVISDLPLRRAVSEWFRIHAGYLVDLESLGAEMQRLVLRPEKSGYDVPFPDAGEGLQQAFPVVAALERLRTDGGLLSIEEPESHLHPRLQRALGDLIVDVLREQPNASVLLETHSEVFLLSALAAAVGALPVDSVRIHWVESGPDGAARAEEVPLDMNGRPTSPRMEQAFSTMGVMRRELLSARKVGAANRGVDGR